MSLTARVAEEIRAVMGRRRLTGAGLARALGVSQMWVSYRLNGQQPIDVNDLERIAQVLDVPVLDLFPAAYRSASTGVTGRQGTNGEFPTPREPVALRVYHPTHAVRTRPANHDRAQSRPSGRQETRSTSRSRTPVRM